MYHLNPSSSHTWQMPVMGWFVLLALTLHGLLFLNEIGTTTEKLKLTTLSPLQLSFYQISSAPPETASPQLSKQAMVEQPQATTTTPVKAVVSPATPLPIAPQVEKLQPSTALANIDATIESSRPATRPIKLQQEPLPAEAEDTTFDVESASSVVSTHLIQMIKNEFNYPILAKRRGWEGKVVLGFNLSNDGKINNIEILHSSGHALLDRNASKTLSQIGLINPITLEQLNWMGTHHLELPVIYQLNRG